LFLKYILFFIKGNQDDDDDDGDANVIDQVTANKCPLTQKPFVEPVQNKKCKHKYEKNMVLKYIADKNKTRRPAKCPAAGCNNILSEKDLINA
jgi:SUMO ligase MMS21 Smc5/6 complex component